MNSNTVVGILVCVGIVAVLLILQAIDDYVDKKNGKDKEEY